MYLIDFLKSRGVIQEVGICFSKPLIFIMNGKCSNNTSGEKKILGSTQEISGYRTATVDTCVEFDATETWVLSSTPTTWKISTRAKAGGFVVLYNLTAEL